MRWTNCNGQDVVNSPAHLRNSYTHRDCTIHTLSTLFTLTYRVIVALNGHIIILKSF